MVRVATDSRWNDLARKLLVGRTVKAVWYMSHEESEVMGWESRALVIEFDNGLQVYASSDDEGNDAGSLFTSDPLSPVLPVLR